MTFKTPNTNQTQWIALVWGALIALSMMRVRTWMFLTPICIVAIIALLHRTTRTSVMDTIAKLPLAPLYGLLAFLSLFWASVPALTFMALRGDILMPCLALLASFYIGRKPWNDERHDERMLLGVWGGFLTGSAIAFWRFGPEWINRLFDSVGYYTTYLFMLAGMSLPFLTRFRRPFFYATLVALLFVTQQRVAWIIFPIIGMADMLLNIDVRTNRSKLLLATVLILCFSVVMMKTVAEKRPVDAFNPTVQAGSIIEMLAKNERLRAWQQWLERGKEAPLLGHGFGRDNVKQHFSGGGSWPEENLNHGHNIILNNFLQLGLFGVVLYLGAQLQLIYYALKQDRKIGYAVALIVLFFLMRNQFDDFSFQRLLSVGGMFVGWCLGKLVENGFDRSIQEDGKK